MARYRDIDSILESLIKKCFAKDKIKIPTIELEAPKDTNFGDLSTNIALRAARLKKQAPTLIADKLIEDLNKEIAKSSIKDDIAQIKNVKGFVNFFFTNQYYYNRLRQIFALKQDFGRSSIGKGKKVLIEFVSANPTGPLSIAHARQAVIGDVLANILDFLGFKVKREYYLNDEGNQINILGDSVSQRLKELNGERIDFPEHYYQGEYIIDLAKKIKDKNLKLKDLSSYAKDYILKVIKKELADFGVKFDYWTSQAKLTKAGDIEKVFATLKEKEFIYQQDGALWFRSTHFGDDKDRVVVKSDGAYTYLAPDMAYHQGKYKRGFDWLINFWGPDHHGYIKRIKAAVEALGHDKESLSVLIVQLVSIFKNGIPMQMSTRRGQYISLREILDQVGKDTSRFFFLMRRTSSQLDFDLEIAKKHTSENPVYYVQYAHARICSIIEKNRKGTNFKKANLNLLKEKEELRLLKTLSEFSYFLHIVLRTLDPYIMTLYLQNLANDFHKFYDSHRVLVEDKALKAARLSLIEGARIVFANGLRLLGVSAPEKM